MIKRIGIVGCFDKNRGFSHTHAVKTNSLYTELSNRGFENILCLDTGAGKKSKANLLGKILKCAISCDIIIFLSSDDELKRLVSLMYMAKKIFKKRIYHYATGDTLPDYVKSTKRGAYRLGFIDANWVECNKVKEKLEDIGLNNCDVVPVFKKTDAKKSIPVPTEDGKNRFCIIGKICADTGIGELLDEISAFNDSHSENVRLQVWGSIDKEYENEFGALLNKYPHIVSYMGDRDFDKNQTAISDNTALLLPKVLKSEGSSLTIIGAYSCGLPVIATDIDIASELIRNFETGWVCPNEKAKNLKDSIEWATEHKDEMTAMRKNCLLFATRYSPDFVVRRLIDKYLKD